MVTDLTRRIQVNHYDQIVDLLGKLTPDELASLERRIKALRSLGSTVSTVDHAIQETANNLEDPEFFVLRCAAEAMQSIGADPCTTMPVLRRSVGPAFRAKLPGLMQYLRSASSRRVERHSLLYVGFHLLYKEMTQRNYVVTTRTLLNHMHRIPAVVEASFPGYLHTGVAKWIRAPNVKPRPRTGSPPAGEPDHAAGVQRRAR
jgi:hypothetical protein